MSLKSSKKPPIKSPSKSQKTKKGDHPSSSKKASAPSVAKSAKSVKTAKPAKGSKPTKTVKPAKVTKTTKPVKATKSAKTEKPVKATKPVKPAKTAKPVKVAKSVKKAAKPTKAVKLPKQNPAFLKKQREKLLHLKDVLLDSMTEVARDSIRTGADSNGFSAFGMHQADAGSDAYDRDFALGMLTQDQNALNEVDQALKRIEDGTYGICEMSGKPIPHVRLEALPFARYTVECQAEIEKRNQYRHHVRQPVSPLFGFGEEDEGESDDEDTSLDNKD